MVMTGSQSEAAATATLQLACKLLGTSWPIVDGIATSAAITASATQVKLGQYPCQC